MVRIIGGLLLAAAVCTAFEAPALRSRYGMNCEVAKDCFVDIPRTDAEAKKAGWVSPQETLNNTLFQTFCLPNNGRICILVDNQGSICGYQISIPKDVDSLHLPRLDYVAKGFKELTLFKKAFYSNLIFFVEQEVLKNGGRKFDGQTGTGLWLQTGEKLTPTEQPTFFQKVKSFFKRGDSKVDEQTDYGTGLEMIPDNVSGMNSTDFVKQSCFPRMGLHYFYKSNKNLQQEEFMPWFILFDNTNGKMVGLGFISFGSKVDDESDTWFENVPAAAVRAIAPSSPEWVFEDLEEYGIFAHHIYIGENPWDIKC